MLNTKVTELVDHHVAVIVAFDFPATNCSRGSDQNRSDRLLDRRRPLRLGLFDSFNQPRGTSPG
jgi:hypothetical protein